MKTIIALDSFKGCLTSTEACQAAATGVRLADPMADVLLVPLSDGGEGLTSVLTHAMHGQMVTVRVHGPLMEPITAQYGIADQQTAIIEMAAACGLPLVPAGLRDPERTTTFGFGEMILDALHRGCKQLILGIGGSATNDAGMGMLQALGATISFSNHEGEDTDLAHSSIACGGNLAQIASIDATPLSDIYNNVCILVASDVHNPLCGPTGAAHIFAPQKGADPEAVERLDQGLHHVQQLAHVADSQPGDGAAGGLGFALRHYLHTSMRPGIELVLDQLHFDQTIADADLIITGEGKSDAQTLMGKVPMGVLKHAQRQGIPVHLIAGCIEDAEQLSAGGFSGLRCINEDDHAPLSELMKPERAIENIQKTVQKIISDQKRRSCSLGSTDPCLGATS